MMLLMNASKDALLARLVLIADMQCEIAKMQAARELHADLLALGDYLYAKGYPLLWQRMRENFPTQLARSPFALMLEKYILEAAEWELRRHEKLHGS